MKNTTLEQRLGEEEVHQTAFSLPPSKDASASPSLLHLSGSNRSFSNANLPVDALAIETSRPIAEDSDFKLHVGPSLIIVIVTNILMQVSC